MASYTFAPVGNRVSMQKGTGAVNVPAPQEVTTSASGTTFKVETGNFIYTINTSSDTVTVDGTTYAPGAKTGAEIQALVVALFPSANSGSGGSGTTNASDLTTGTLDDARLSSNISLRADIGTTAGITYRKKSTYNTSLTLYQNIMNNNAEFLGLNRNTFGTVALPVTFSYFTPTIRRGDILSYKTSIDEIRDWRTAYMNATAGKKVYFVSESGNDANSGLTPALALRSIRTALAKSDMITVIVMSGVYATGGNHTPNGTHTGNYNLICNPNAHIGGFQIFSGFAWDATYTNLAVLTDASVSQITAVYDRLMQKSDGSFTQFRLATSAADCATKYKSYYITGTTIYVNYHTLPTADYNNVLFSLGGRMALSSGSNSNNIYCEGGQWYATIQLRSQGNAGACPTAYLRDMNIVKSSGVFNVLWAEGYSCGSYNVVIQQCGTEDGFNYHTYGSSDPSLNFEINCKVLYQQGMGASDQSTTLHEACKCVTINAEYLTNGDQVAHDIGQSKRVFLGCYLSASTNSGNGGGVVRSSELNTEVYLENCCLGGDAASDIYLGSGGSIYLRGTLFRAASSFDGTYTFDTW